MLLQPNDSADSSIDLVDVLSVAGSVATLLTVVVSLWFWVRRRRRGVVSNSAKGPSGFRLLVVDDKKFPHVDRLHNDGYQVSFANDVERMSEIGEYQYDLILMDLHGVGRKISPDGGEGIIRSLKSTSPTQLILAYTAQTRGLTEFAKVAGSADHSLSKGDSYLDFKNAIDTSLATLSTPSHYLDNGLASLNATQRRSLKPLVEQALAGEPVSESLASAVQKLPDEHRDAARRTLKHASIVGRRMVVTRGA